MQYGLIGEKLGHSFSKEIHGLLGNDAYELNPLSRDELGPFLSARKFCAINVTVPYKKAVIPFLDELAPEAARIGAVNTIVNRNGRLCGYNTDLPGFEYLCKAAGIAMKGRKVLVFGSGGTCLTVSEAALRAGAKSLTAVSRHGENNYENLRKNADAEVLINTTPVGMFPDIFGCITDLSIFPELKGVVDVVYNPLETELIYRARERTLPCGNGLRMLVSQAVYADALFFGKQADEHVCEQLYRKVLAGRRNIVLIGMSGSGKSTVGRETARILGRECADTDVLIEQKCGMSVPEIFKKHGETYFRQLEKETIAALAGKTGIVTAVGGGAVLDEDNYKALRRNGLIVFLRRGIDAIAITDRPKTPDRTALAALYQRRLPVYEQRCDVSIQNEGTPVQAAMKIKTLSEEYF